MAYWYVHRYQQSVKAKGLLDYRDRQPTPYYIVNALARSLQTSMPPDSTTSKS